MGLQDDRPDLEPVEGDGAAASRPLPPSSARPAAGLPGTSSIAMTSEALTVRLPNPALIVLVGLQGSGKSTLAHRHFAPVEILSTDDLRARVCNDPASQANSCVAREHLLAVLRERLRNRVTTVVDSTNLRSEQRAELLEMAAGSATPAIALLFTAGPERCRARIAYRASIIHDAILEQNADLLERTLRRIDDEGWVAVFRLDDEQLRSITFDHALPDDSDPDRWFEVEQIQPSAWTFRHPADHLRRHPAVLAEIRPTWDFIARVAADMAFAARISSSSTRLRTRIGTQVRVRLPHCLPIDLVARPAGWERVLPRTR